MKKRIAWSLALAIVWIAGAVGCSGDRSVPGGTAGTLRSATGELRDVRIDVFPVGATQPIGFGVTSDGGRFELYQPDASAGLILPDGNYLFTLESVGPDPLPLAPVYRDPQRTPLRQPWDGSATELQLVLPR